MHYTDFTRVTYCFILAWHEVFYSFQCVSVTGDFKTRADGVSSSRADRDWAKISSVCVLWRVPPHSLISSEFNIKNQVNL